MGRGALAGGARGASVVPCREVWLSTCLSPSGLLAVRRERDREPQRCPCRGLRGGHASLCPSAGVGAPASAQTRTSVCGQSKARRGALFGLEICFGAEVGLLTPEPAEAAWSPGRPSARGWVPAASCRQDAEAPGEILSLVWRVRMGDSETRASCGRGCWERAASIRFPPRRVLGRGTCGLMLLREDRAAATCPVTSRQQVWEP